MKMSTLLALVLAVAACGDPPVYGSWEGPTDCGEDFTPITFLVDVKADLVEAKVVASPGVIVPLQTEDFDVDDESVNVVLRLQESKFTLDLDYFDESDSLRGNAISTQACSIALERSE